MRASRTGARALVLVCMVGTAPTGMILSTNFASAALAVPAAEDSPPQNTEEVAGDSHRQTLDDLFEKLAASKSKQGADLAVASIWRVWLDSGSDTIDLLTRRAIEAIRVEDFESALQILDEVVVLAPDYAEGWNKRATVHYIMRHYDASIFDVRRALALEPRHFGALTGLGTMLKDTGLSKAALGVYRKLLKINPHLEKARKAVEELTVEVEGREI